MKTRKTSRKKSLKRPVQESDESETESFGNENESGNNEQQSYHYLDSLTSSSVTAKRRKIPTENPNDSVELIESGDFSSPETKCPEKGSTVVSSAFISRTQVDLDGAADLAESSNTLDTPEINAAHEYATDLDHETMIANLKQENPIPEETTAILAFPELSLEFEENNQPLKTPEYMEDTPLRTPEMPLNYEGNFEFSYRNEIDSEHYEESEVANNSSKYNYESENDKEWEYLTGGSGLEKEDEYAEFEDDTGVEKNVRENEFSGEDGEEPISQSEEDDGGEEEQESSQSEDESQENVNESNSDDSEQSQSEEEVDEKESGQSGAEETVSEKEFARNSEYEDGDISATEDIESEKDVESESEEETEQEESESDESTSETESNDDEDEDEEINPENQDTEENEEPKLELVNDLQLKYENFEETKLDNNENEALNDCKNDEKIIPEYLKEVEVEEAHTDSIEGREKNTIDEGLNEESAKKLFTEESLEQTSKDIGKESETELAELREDSCNETTDKVHVEVPAEPEAADIIRQMADLQNTLLDRLSDKEFDMSSDKGADNQSTDTTEKTKDNTNDFKRDSDTDNESHSYSSISCANSDDDMSNPFPTVKVEGLDVDLNSKVLSPTKKANVRTDDPKSTSKSPKILEEPSKTEIPQPREPLAYIAEAMQNILSQPINQVVREQHDSPARSQKSIRKESKPSEKKKSKKKKTKEEDSSSGSSLGNLDGSPFSVLEKKQKSDKTLKSFPTKMPQKTTEKEQKPTAGPDAGPSVASVKDSDSDDSNWQRKSKVVKTEPTSGKDFFEDESSYEEEKINSDDDEEDIRPRETSETSFVVVLSDYELLFQEIRKLIEKVPNRSKYELHTLLFPILAITYLRMISSGKYRKGKTFVDNSVRYLDHSYTSRVDKLIVLQSSEDLPKKARKLLGDENEQLSISMYGDTYRLLLLHMQSLSRSLQLTFIRHFDLLPDYDTTEPRQHAIVGAPMPDKIFWANPEALKEKKENSPPSRRKRFKNFKPSVARNVNLPTCTRLYTPTLKRWDLEQLREDEERRVPLNRESLPSAYLYTAIESVETVICAIFSNNTTMLCIGTNSSTIHIYSLTSSKLAQLKSADFLKNLDTGMSGIDESMLDASNKKMRRTLVGHQGPVYGCAFAPNDRFLLSCSHDRTVRCWCLLSWSCVVIYPGHSSAVYGVCYAPLGYYFATVSDDRTARVWMQDSKKSLCILVGHLAEVICCIFHPNRHYLATGSADCTVRMWDIVKAVQVRVFSGHREPVNTLAYSICGRYLVSGADDNYIVVWDTDKEQLVRSLFHHTEAVNCLQFGMDNKVFVAGGQDCELSIWDFEGIIQEYDLERVKLGNDKEAKQGRQRSSKGDSSAMLIKSYASKDTPFYMLHITRRNLLLCFCVQRVEDDAKKSKELGQAEAKYREWLEFLDILKLKACFEDMEEQSEMKQEEAVEPEAEEVDCSKQEQAADQALQSSINELFAE